MSLRSKQARLVEKHLKDLEKRGIDVSRATQGKSIEKLAYSKKSYKQFMERKSAILSKERDIKKRTNQHGYTFTHKEYKEIKKLENEMRKKKQAEFWKLEKLKGGFSDVEEAFLKGSPIRHKNSKENIELQTSFREESYFNSFIGNGMDLNYFKEVIKEDIQDFSYKDVIDEKRLIFKKQMQEWANAGRFGYGKESFKKERVNELMEAFDNMDFIQKVQFNQDMSHKLQYVDSSSTNKYSVWDERRLLLDLMKQQKDRDFIVSN